MKKLILGIVLSLMISLPSFAYTKFELFNTLIVVCSSSYVYGWNYKNCSVITSAINQNFSNVLSLNQVKNLSNLANECCKIGIKDRENNTNTYPALYNTLFDAYEKNK